MGLVALIISLNFWACKNILQHDFWSAHQNIIFGASYIFLQDTHGACLWTENGQVRNTKQSRKNLHLYKSWLSIKIWTKFFQLLTFKNRFCDIASFRSECKNNQSFRLWFFSNCISLCLIGLHMKFFCSY